MIFRSFHFFLVIKKIIIPELMGALLKFFEIDLCISQLAAIVIAVRHPSPPPLHWHSFILAATQHSVLLMFSRDFSASCSTQNSLLHATAAAFDLPLWGCVKERARKQIYDLSKAYAAPSLSMSPTPSLCLSPTTGSSSLLQSLACCCCFDCCMLFSKCIICAIPHS